MRVYNRKGLAFGIFWAVLGAARLVLLVIAPEDQTAQFVKGLVLGIFMLIFGVSMILRAFSKEATREDRIEERDERNALVKLKAQARTSTVMFWTIIVFMAAGLIGYMTTENMAYAFVCTVPAVMLIVYFAASFIASIYYERRE